jgi:hypothetical protein
MDYLLYTCHYSITYKQRVLNFLYVEAQAIV